MDKSEYFLWINGSDNQAGKLWQCKVKNITASKAIILNCTSSPPGFSLSAQGLQQEQWYLPIRTASLVFYLRTQIVHCNIFIPSCLSWSVWKLHWLLLASDMSAFFLNESTCFTLILLGKVFQAYFLCLSLLLSPLVACCSMRVKSCSCKYSWFY